MKYLIPILILVLGSCKGQDKRSEESSPIAKRVSIEEFNSIIANDEVQLVDVRTANEYRGGYIDDATNIDFLADEFLKLCESQLDKNKPLAIYCAGGGRSAKALVMLKESGFNEIYELGVGYNGYK